LRWAAARAFFCGHTSCDVFSYFNFKIGGKLARAFFIPLATAEESA
jgi:hypothetical protein